MLLGPFPIPEELQTPIARPSLLTPTGRTLFLLSCDEPPSVSFERESNYCARMAEAYSLRWFLLHANQMFLQEFFHRQNLLQEVPFAGVGDGDTDTIFAAIQALGRDQRDDSEACFQDIYQFEPCFYNASSRRPDRTGEGRQKHTFADPPWFVPPRPAPSTGLN